MHPVNPGRAEQLQALVEHLGDGWHIAPGYHHGDRDAYLHGPDGEQLHVTYGSDSHRRAEWGRVFFATALPDHLRGHQPYQDNGPSVAVSETRAPAAVAADLRRRLLPRHRAYLGAVIARATEDADEQARTGALRTLLLRILAGEDTRWIAHRQQMAFGRVGDPIEGDVRVQAYASTVRFEIEASRACAPAVALALAALRGINTDKPAAEPSPTPVSAAPRPRPSPSAGANRPACPGGT